MRCFSSVAGLTFFMLKIGTASCCNQHCSRLLLLVRTHAQHHSAKRKIYSKHDKVLVATTCCYIHVHAACIECMQHALIELQPHLIDVASFLHAVCYGRKSTISNPCSIIDDHSAALTVAFSTTSLAATCTRRECTQCSTGGLTSLYITVKPCQHASCTQFPVTQTLSSI